MASSSLSLKVNSNSRRCYTCGELDHWKNDQEASLLLLFNSSERLSYSEIKEQLNLTDDDVIRLLHSLSCAKYKILNKVPNTKTISQKKKVIEDVDKDRSYAIDASIVRIMKSRKFLGHQQLVMECVNQLGRQRTGTGDSKGCCWQGLEHVKASGCEVFY